ncbi:hypothetical protein [Prauserella muralis]|uniref:Uncharacterized protein n=1 Tax=Prauserella muralis TaxID=588067 RepID=A0A2V4BB04_9PSEU|nr:hypothetical protein [Prauserella muralis]PXY32241.1 hypothetical protein BAY60_08120 [Prauserella muralis]TWE24094.1 hypothetical protein FHX69_5401 [Prauserella muralis]
MTIMRFAAGLSSVLACCLLTPQVASATAPAFLVVDKSTVAPGELVRVSAGCPLGEGVNHVGSAAFAPTGHDGPYSGNGGVARLTAQAAGAAAGRAVIRPDAAPGRYDVTLRCGGGHAGTTTLDVRFAG